MKYEVLTYDHNWTDWEYPNPTYRLACCSCGLVHDLRFQVFKVSDCERGRFNVVGPASRREFRAAFKIRVNNRATAAMRRHG